MDQQQSQPWWKFGYVWMVIAGPGMVVVASLITLYFVIASPNYVVNGYGQEPSPESRMNTNTSGNMAPALQGRNHAATGVLAPAKP